VDAYPTLLLALAAITRLGAAQDRARVTSPDGRNAVTVEVRDGALTYTVDRDGRSVLLPSRLGFAFQGAPPLRDSLRMVDTSRQHGGRDVDATLGEVARVRDHHNELRSQSRKSRRRADGSWWCSGSLTTGSASATSFRRRPGSRVRITDELTEFALADDARAWWIPSNVRASTARRCCSRPPA